MKTFNLTRLLNSLLTVVVFALIFTACGKEEIDTTPIAVDHSELAKRVANDANFQALEKINEEVVRAVQNGVAVEDLTVVPETQLATIRTQLMKNIPALQDLNQEDLKSVLEEASILRQPTVERSPNPGCAPCLQEASNALNTCNAATYFVYLSGGSYQAYLDAYYDFCVPQYYSTVNACPC